MADPEKKLYKRLSKRINPADKYIVGAGSGLGLSIVKEITDAHEGKVGFTEPFDDWRCNLEMVLPR